jgi:hypothetical protein
MPDPEFTDSNGRPLAGRALDVAREARIRKLEEAERAAQTARDEAEQARAALTRVERTTARALVAAAAAEARRTGQAVPDLLRARLGADADEILRAAAVPAPAAPRPAQQSSSPWAGSPDHDERVTRALLHGAPDAELAQIRQQVAAEYEGRRLERQARDDEYYNRTGAQAVNRDRLPMPTPPPMAFAARDERGVPVQASRTVPGSGPAEGSA